MRRLALTLFASFSVAVLSACSGYGGSAIGGGQGKSFDRLVFSTAGSQLSGIYKVAPTLPAASPLYVSVYGARSSFNVAQFDTTATFAVTYAPAGAQYQNSANGTTASCLLTQNASGIGFADPSTALVVNTQAGFAPYVNGFSQTIGIVPVSPGVSAAGQALAAPGGASYCLNVVATAQNGVIGNFIVYVGN